MSAQAGHTCVMGLGWGDEGKGKIVNLLCPDYDVVVRFNGGANAGHTVCFGGETFALHLLPGGVLQSGKRSVIGPGVAVDPQAVICEIDALSDRGRTEKGRFGSRLECYLPSSWRWVGTVMLAFLSGRTHNWRYRKENTMSVRTAADEALDQACSSVQDAVKSLSEIVVDRCGGHDQWNEEYTKKIQQALNNLLSVRISLERPA